MDRRSLLKLLAAGALAPPFSPELLAPLRTVHASPSNATTLNKHQHATVVMLADLILPRTETPGALDAGVVDFIDRILTHWYDPPERDRFLEGLSQIDVLSNQRFASDFIALSPDQRHEVLVHLGDGLRRDVESLANHPRGYRGSAPEPNHNFYFTLRQLVLVGYFTSEIGFAQQLHGQVIPARVDFCAPASPESPGAEE